ncbi:DUF4396 domain-containing protein [Haloarcula onubensis]|uniref:DUF4396 domain-containing protein n=1 Tax=Haloarcula onubensis TaxID=2950539 RepID=A0ABU2FPL2_9EURY|nr:DUF4396 domain-containing protein [Halomicroarcula sp. S3CR25-11]MDS0282684.1 DUF4396 domain-containing protein [Halomicroarcula sp. S3CR25-11]
MPLQEFLTQIEHTLAPVRHVMKPILSDPLVMGVWALFVVAAVGTLWWDIRKRNQALPSLMKGVWTLVVLYSGPLGLAIYWYAGRTQISHDSLWRRGFRSTVHCYSGCGAGEVVGFALLAGLLALQRTTLVTVGTFALAYTFGYALTVGPLLQEGVGFGEAMVDALYSETPSITIMEIAAIGTDLLVASQAHISDLLFWGALVFSLSVGYVFAFPVNAALVYVGVKEGMENPAEMGQSQRGAQAAD